MERAAGAIRSNEERGQHVWPLRTRAISTIGSACVIQGTGDFALDDLNLVRRRFPNQRVTLDGDVITVWPPVRQP